MSAPNRQAIVTATLSHLAKRGAAEVSKLNVEDDGKLAIVIVNDPNRGVPATAWAAAQATKKEAPGSGSAGSGPGASVSEGA